MNTDENPTVTVSHGIFGTGGGIPTTIVFKDGSEIYRLVGAYQKQLDVLNCFYRLLGTPDVERTVHVKIDATAPATEVAVRTTAKSTEVTFTASDGGSGVASTEYRLKGAAGWTSYLAPFEVSTPGTSTYEYRSTDLAGNVEVSKEFTVRMATLPAVARLSPTVGRRGAIVTVTGSGFGASRVKSSVNFGAKACSTYVSWADARIVCRVPAKAKLGTLKVTVVTVGGKSNAMSFTVKR